MEASRLLVAPFCPAWYPVPALVAQAHAHTPVGCVLADAEFDSERSHTFVRQQLHALSIIPTKRGKKTWTLHGVRAQMRHDFPRRKYCRRALIETVFSVAKRKLSCRAPGRCLLTQRRQALLSGLTYNLYRLQHVDPYFRMSTEPDSFYQLDLVIAALERERTNP